MQFMKWRILLSDFRCRKKHRGKVEEKRHQIILIPTQDHMYTGFFLGFMYITRVKSTSGQQISFLLERAAYPIDLTQLNRTPIIGCGVLLAGRMTALCSVIQLLVPWIVKETSAIKQAKVGVLCAFRFLPFSECFCLSYTTLRTLYSAQKSFKSLSKKNLWDATRNCRGVCDRRERLTCTSNSESGYPGFKASPVSLFP